MTTLHGKVVFVTGASSGIGRATALRLAGQGALLALSARNQDALNEVACEVEKLGSRALVVPADVTESAQVGAAIESAVAHFGRLDILISSAGLSMRASFEESQLAALEHVMRVNFFGTLYATHAALPHIKRTQGSLVAISSLTGKRGIPTYAVYGASKFAVQGLYDALRVELAPAGVHVGVVAPAFVDTPLREHVLGPNGKPWPVPPKLPFRLWPVELCVDRIVRLIVRRRRQALLPAFTGPLLILDQILGQTLGDRILTRRFLSAETEREGPK